MKFFRRHVFCSYKNGFWKFGLSADGIIYNVDFLCPIVTIASILYLTTPSAFSHKESRYHFKLRYGFLRLNFLSDVVFVVFQQTLNPYGGQHSFLGKWFALSHTCVHLSHPYIPVWPLTFFTYALAGGSHITHESSTSSILFIRQIPFCIALTIKSSKNIIQYSGFFNPYDKFL